MINFEFEFCDLRFICNLEFEIWNLYEIILEKKVLFVQSEVGKFHIGHDTRRGSNRYLIGEPIVIFPKSGWLGLSR